METKKKQIKNENLRRAVEQLWGASCTGNWSSQGEEEQKKNLSKKRWKFSEFVAKYNPTSLRISVKSMHKKFWGYGKAIISQSLCIR